MQYLKTHFIYLGIVLFLNIGTATFAITIEEDGTPIDENHLKTALANGESATVIAEQLLENEANPLLIAEKLAQAAPQSAAQVAAFIAHSVPPIHASDVAATIAEVVPSAATQIAVSVADVMPQFVVLLVRLADAIIEAVPESEAAIKVALKDKIAAAHAIQKHENQQILTGQGAGIVAWVDGEAHAVLPNGDKQILETGAELSNGTTIVTHNQSVVLIYMPDHSSYVVEEHSQFKINKYHFEESKPEQDSSVFSLVKGMFRFVSGMIGKRNPAKVEYYTPTTTMGIRGTEGTLRYKSTDDQSYVHVVSGQMSIAPKYGGQHTPVDIGIYGITPTGTPHTNVSVSIIKHFKIVKPVSERSRHAAVTAHHQMASLYEEITSGRKQLSRAEIKSFKKRLKKLHIVIKNGGKHHKKKRWGVEYENPNLSDPLLQKATEQAFYTRLMDYAKHIKKGHKRDKALKAMHKKFKHARKIKKHKEKRQHRKKPSKHSKRDRDHKKEHQHRKKPGKHGKRDRNHKKEHRKKPGKHGKRDRNHKKEHRKKPGKHGKRDRNHKKEHHKHGKHG